MTEDPKREAKLEAIRLQRIGEAAMKGNGHAPADLSSILSAMALMMEFWEHCKQNGLCPNRDSKCKYCDGEVW